MSKLKAQVVLFLPVLLFLLAPGESGFTNMNPVTDIAVPEVSAPLPCAELRVDRTGAVCRLGNGFEAILQFPAVDLKAALEGKKYLPASRKVFTVNKGYLERNGSRNKVLILEWVPATPDFLQIYLDEYLPHWGERIPYRLFWSTHIEICSNEFCTDRKITAGTSGEILPSDVGDLDSGLAADNNFSGVPAAFWNTNILP